MATYSRSERLAAIQKAGFANPLTALAVSLAEFGESRDINAQAQSDVYTNGVREPSFGPWQIHLPAHPDVTQACAMDLTCSTAKAAQISKGGTDFGAWSAFTNGGYLRFLSELAPTASPAPAATGAPSTSGSSAPSSTDSGSGTNAADAFCGLDQLSRLSVATRIKAGESPEAIAADLTKRLARAITLQCVMASSAQSATETKYPGQDFLKANSPLEFFKALLAPENLWRSGFLILGAALIFFGARMYLAPDRSEASRENVA